jgi:hypothetical protein
MKRKQALPLLFLCVAPFEISTPEMHLLPLSCTQVSAQHVHLRELPHLHEGDFSEGLAGSPASPYHLSGAPVTDRPGSVNI